jgi:simple sugar transport system substrate-binding protein/basic membrane protein A
MTGKRMVLALLLVVLLSLPLAACGAGSGAEGIRMAVLLSGTVDDLSWNYQMQQAALKIAEEKGFEVEFSEKVPAADAERVIREYIDRDFNFIIAHSFGYGEAVFKVAPDHPDVNFAWPGGIQRTAENVADYDQPFYQAAYILGVMAGGVSESGTFSFLSGFDIPVCHSMMESFKLGAQQTNPNAEVLYTVMGDWVDVQKAKEAVLAHVDAGADYVASCGFGPTLGAIEAAEEAGIFASSYVGDMSSIAPNNVLLNMVWDLYPLLSTMVDEIEADTFQPGKWYTLGVAEGSLRVEINSALADEVPASAREQADEVIDQIEAGTFEVPYVPEGE